MIFTRTSKHRVCFRFAVWLPDVFDGEDRERHALGVPQRDASARRQRLCKLLGHVQIDGDRPEPPVWQAHVVAHAAVFRAREVALQWGKGTVQKQLEVPDLTETQLPGRQENGFVLELLNTLFAGEKWLEIVERFVRRGRHGILPF